MLPAFVQEESSLGTGWPERLAYRELDEALGLTGLVEELLNDWRPGKNTQHSMVSLMGITTIVRLVQSRHAPSPMLV
jgi:hypothetical protein